MAKYYVKMMVEFSGEIYADSMNEAEDYAWRAWGTEADAEIAYDNVYSIKLDKIEGDDEDEEEEE